MNITILDKNLVSQNIVDVYNSFIWTERYAEAGDFELTLAMSSNPINNISIDNYVAIPTSKKLMIIDNVEIDSSSEDGAHLKLSGTSIETLLSRRIIWGQMILEGSLQDGVEKILNESVISPEDAKRKIYRIRFIKSEDPRITALTMEAQYFGDNVFEAIKAICQSKNLGFKMELSDEDTFDFSIYFGEDRTYNQSKNDYVIFSPEYDNMISSNYIETKVEYRNVTLVGGENYGSERKTASVGDAEGYDRREVFTDASSLSSNTSEHLLSDAEYKAQLEEAGTEELAKYKLGDMFEGEFNFVEPFMYGRDFFMGDIVEIMNEFGHGDRVYVDELIISSDMNGETMYPTFSSCKWLDESPKASVVFRTTGDAVNFKGVIVSLTKDDEIYTSLTNEYGVATFDLPEVGTYTVGELTPPTGYTIEYPSTITISDLDVDYVFDILMEIITVSHIIFKAVGEENVPINNISIKIQNGSVVFNGVTDINGVCVFEVTTLGIYDITLDTTNPKLILLVQDNIEVAALGQEYNIQIIAKLLVYNIYGDVGKYTNIKLSDLTQYQIRNEVIK